LGSFQDKALWIYGKGRKSIQTPPVLQNTFGAYPLSFSQIQALQARPGVFPMKADSHVIDKWQKIPRPGSLWVV